MFRSKSRSQAGGAGGPPQASQSSRSPSSAAVGGRANAVVKNILKNVESHVRVMSHLENISIASSYTALRLRKPRGRRVDGEDEWSSPFTVSRVHKGVASSRDASQADPASAASGSTFAFYSDVIAPCVSNCCAGQSYLFLFSGPQESGRSQTLYGCPPKHSKHAPPNPSQDPRLYPEANEDGNERGVVELAAIDFLERVTSRRQQRLDDEGGGGASAAGQEEGRSGGGGLVVTFSAFTTRGEQITDTITKDEVQMESFPPPLGVVPLPHMHLLDSDSIESFTFSAASGKSLSQRSRRKGGEGDGAAGTDDVVPILPEKKYLDTSCIIQFQVYASVEGGAGPSSSINNNSGGAGVGKRTMATFTFVDVAAFRAPLCREVATLVDTIRRVAGLSDTTAAEDASTQESGAELFHQSKLTTLLEPALTGYVTLVSVSTISGREDLFDGACAALSFAQDVKRIHQVFLLLHIFTPRWLFETGCALESLRDERERVLKGHYARGVYDYYKTAAKWLLENVGDVEGQLEKLLAETETIRQGIEGEVQSQERRLQDEIAREEATVKDSAEEARRALQENTAQFEVVKRLDEEVARVEQRISQNDLKASQRIGEMRIEISALEAKKSSREKDMHQLSREKSLFSSKGDEVISVLRKYAEDMAYAQVAYSSQHELRTIHRKRSRLEADLELASSMAMRATDTLRTDRARRALLSRLATLQDRIDSLRETINTTRDGGLKEALASVLDVDDDADEGEEEDAGDTNGGNDRYYSSDSRGGVGRRGGTAQGGAGSARGSATTATSTTTTTAVGRCRHASI